MFLSTRASRFAPITTLALASALITTTWAHAKVALSPLFSNGMVLQQKKPLNVWGTADKGEEVTVTFNGKSASAKADDQGQWKVTLPAMTSTKKLKMVVKGTNQITIDNVLMGEVWVCGGQSNMAWRLRNSFEPQKNIREANFPNIRLFTVKRDTALKPSATIDVGPQHGKWLECTPENAADFSAVGYFFGRFLHKKLDVPIGLISSNYGGTPAEAWMPREYFAKSPVLQSIVDREQRMFDNYDAWMVSYKKKLEKWKVDVAKAKEAGKKPPRKPFPPRGPKSPHSTAVLYNAMIAPLQPYTIAGVIWYQGESNGSRGWEYATLFPQMIESWRQTWGQGDFPFLFVQLAPFMQKLDTPQEGGWPELREAQYQTLKKSPNTHMAIITDVGNQTDIHPKKKQPVGERLGLGALALAYKQETPFRGPMHKDVKFQDGKAVVTFDVEGEKLQAKPEGALTGFTIAGPDKKFYLAQAKIASDTVVVWSDQVKDPKAVRFGWYNFPVVNLWSSAGLPASPFRTDDWRLRTQPAPKKDQKKPAKVSAGK